MVIYTQAQEVLINCRRHHINNVWFQKTFILPPWRVIGNSEDEGCLKAKVLKKKCEAKLEILYQEGWR